MRHRNASFTRLLLPALANLFLLGHLVGCGGSAAETPEPVRPDDWQLRLRQGRQAPSQSGRAEDSAVVLGRDLEAPSSPPRSARSTWGSGRRRVVPTPTSVTTEAPGTAPTGSNPATTAPLPTGAEPSH